MLLKLKNVFLNSYKRDKVNFMAFKVKKLNYKETHSFSKTVLDYLSENESIKPFYKYSVNIKAFEKIIEDKQKQKIDRETLTTVLNTQYDVLDLDIEASKKKIEFLKSEQTFTVTTAHQINLFTGPLYVIFKIVSCINLAKTLTQQYPNYNFVPVFWMGSEDHDFEEVNHLNLFNKKTQWQNSQKGATGRMLLTGIDETIGEVEKILGDSKEADFLMSRLKESFTKEKTFGAATFHFLHQLFGKYGLLILNADDEHLKQQFIGEMKSELLEEAIYNEVNKTNQQFEENYKVQASPRKINLFYLKDNLRERIIKNEQTDLYEINNSNLKFTKTELLEELNNHPERFSPNVLMRPLYQEKILPNLAYIGGGGELAYWLELKSTFEHFKINFPILILRNSAQFVDKKTNTKWQNTGFLTAELFQPFDALSKLFISKNEATKIDFTEHKNSLQQLKEAIEKEALTVDPNLHQPLEAEFAKMNKSMQNLEQKFVRAAKRKSSEPLNQIQNIQNKLLPNGGVHERYDNFMQYYLKWGDAFFDLLFEHFDCLEKQFLLVVEE